MTKSLFQETDPTLFFRGRPGDPRLGELVTSLSNRGHEDLQIAQAKLKIGIFGSPDDLGVTSNRGRAGASKAPDSIRKFFYKLALPFDQLFESRVAIIDCGNITAHPTDILLTHKASQEASLFASQHFDMTISLGGGHDFAAPHFFGWESSHKKAGLINIDPHLDVRELENGLPHSGTPFRQIIESKKIAPKNIFQFGARQGRNARRHYEFCKANGVTVDLFETMIGPNNPQALFAKRLKKLTTQAKHIFLTIDMDACHEAEGTSAAPVIGFSATDLCRMAYLAGLEPKVTHLDLCEVAPPLDTTERSSRIAAEIMYHFIVGRFSSLSMRAIRKKTS